MVSNMIARAGVKRADIIIIITLIAPLTVALAYELGTCVRRCWDNATSTAVGCFNLKGVTMFGCITIQRVGLGGKEKEMSDGGLCRAKCVWLATF